MSSDPAATPPPPMLPDDRQDRRERWRRGGYGGPWSGGMWMPFWGVALVLVGVYYLLKNVGLLSFLHDDVLWPVLLIALGIFLIVRRSVNRQ